MSILDAVKAMSPERFQAIYESLMEQGYGPLDGDVARALKFRPHAIRKLPIDKRAQKARQLLLAKGQADLAYELCGGYLIRTHEKLMPEFLDAVGVPHEDGMIENTAEALPDEDKLEPALEELDGKYPAEDVTLYLGICATQWPQVPKLGELYEARLDA